MNALVSIIYEAAQNSGTSPFLFYGTLLGHVREKDFICYDFDVDVGILREDYDKLLQQLRRLVDTKYTSFKLKCINIFGYRSMALHDIETKINADIDEFYIEKNRMIKNMPQWYTRYWWKEKHTKYPAEWVLPLKQEMFNDTLVNIPTNADNILTYIYGDSYKTPNYQCDAKCNNCVEVN
jgi:phosphorylcholine metabolism protein LicD